MRTFKNKDPCVENSRIANYLPVCQSVQKRLVGSGYLSLDNVHVHYEDGVITLNGCVPTYFMRDLAEQIALEDENVRSVCNNIEVIATNRLNTYYRGPTC